MHRYPVSAAVIFAALLGGGAISEQAGPFDVKGPEIEKGETEISTNHVFQSGFPANADRVRHSYELAASYARTCAEANLDRVRQVFGPQPAPQPL